MGKPFIKWAGGKTQLLPILLEVLPRQAETYYEPFLGGGAVFFSLVDRYRFHSAVLNDFNQELVNTYRAVRDRVEDVISLLREMPFDREFYEDLRRRHPGDLAEIGARVIYLNKTCFTPGSMVLTENEEYIPIEECSVGQRLWGGRTVQEVLARPYNGGVLRVRVQSCPFTLSVTEDHPVLKIPGRPPGTRQEKRSASDLLSEMELAPASSLRTGDYVLLPREGTRETTIDWTAFLPKDVAPQARPVSGRFGDGRSTCRLLGYYAAEGSTWFQHAKPARIDWYFNKNEKSYIEDVRNICREVFGIEPSVYPAKGKELTTVSLRSVLAAGFIHNLVPGKVWAKDSGLRKTKRLHSVLMQAPVSLQLEILRGWFRGDGGLSSDDKQGSHSLTGTSTVIPMAQQMYRLCQRCGFRPSWWVSHPKTASNPEGGDAAQVALCISQEIEALTDETLKRKRASCAQRRFVGDYIAVQVKEVTSLEYSGTVYNLEVDGDHLICVDGVISHNCYNGLYRVNKKGEFNAPFGDFASPPRILRAKALRECSEILQYGAALYSGDFADAVIGAREGDVVYFDPPYVPLNATSNFTSYTRDGFTLDDQKRLVSAFQDLQRRGVKAVVSNSDTPTVRDLYKDFEVYAVPVRRPINSDGDARGFVQEVLVFNYPDPDRGLKMAQITHSNEARRQRQMQRRQGRESESPEAYKIAIELGWDDDDDDDDDD